MARGVELEPVAAEPETGPVRLKVYEPDPVPETPDVLTEVELPEFDEALLAKVFANLASHGMTLQHNQLNQDASRAPSVGAAGACFTEGSARSATPFEALAPHFA